MSWNKMNRAVLAAAEALQEALEEFAAEDGAPSEYERREIAQALFLLQESFNHVRRRAGVSPLWPAKQAPDWSWRMSEVRQGVGDIIDVAQNFRPGTEGPGIGAARRGVDLLRQALRQFQRAGVESVAS